MIEVLSSDKGSAANKDLDDMKSAVSKKTSGAKEALQAVEEAI